MVTVKTFFSVGTVTAKELSRLKKASEMNSCAIDQSITDEEFVCYKRFSSPSLLVSSQSGLFYFAKRNEINGVGRKNASYPKHSLRQH